MKKYELIKLSYSYDSLEPIIDKQTMELHHSKHHQGYVKNLNKALDEVPNLYDTDLFSLLQNPNKIPKSIRQRVINHGGGTFNHNLYFNNLKLNNGKGPKGELLKAIDRDFGSFDNFINEFSNKATSQFGSGWAWLLTDKKGNLSVTNTSNQDVPKKGIPILNVDVWEHAYYLKYQNKRASYVENFFKVINWDNVEKLYINR